MGHVLVLAAALTCLRLGWWQWKVFEDAGGTGQNLGYSMLWPVFAGAFIYMWLRFLQLEERRESEGEAEPKDNGDDHGAGGIKGVALHDGAEPPAAGGPADLDGRRRGRRHKYRSERDLGAQTVGVGYIGGDDDDDPELAAYNRALAQLAEQDEHRAD